MIDDAEIFDLCFHHFLTFSVILHNLFLSFTSNETSIVFTTSKQTSYCAVISVPLLCAHASSGKQSFRHFPWSNSSTVNYCHKSTTIRLISQYNCGGVVVVFSLFLFVETKENKHNDKHANSEIFIWIKKQHILRFKCQLFCEIFLVFFHSN